MEPSRGPPLNLHVLSIGIHRVDADAKDNWGPRNYRPHAALPDGAKTGARVLHTNDTGEAMEGADAVYTDVWASMGQEDEIEERAAVFAECQVDEQMMSRTNDAAQGVQRLLELPQVPSVR